MPRTCSICNHPKREHIDQAILDGVPNRSVASQFESTYSSIDRHKAHVTAALAQNKDQRNRSIADSFVFGLFPSSHRVISRPSFFDLEYP